MQGTVGKRLGVGRAAEVFEYGQGKVLKVIFKPEDARWLRLEMAAQSAAADAGVNAPAVFELVDHAGRPGLVMERIDGEDGLSLLERKPWKMWQIPGGRVGRLHASLATVPAPEGLLALRAVIRHQVTNSASVPESARARILAILDGLPDGDRLCHLDFHPGNVIFVAEGPVVIDFASARRGDPIADHVKALMLLQAGSPPDMSPWVKFLVRFGRRVVRFAYTRGYGKLSAEDALLAHRWRVVLAGERLAEGIPEEREQLLRMLSRSLREAERD